MLPKPQTAQRPPYLGWLLVPALLLLWAGFAGWQWHEFSHEQEQARESLDRQAKTAHHLLVSSIVSHRRMGPSFDTMVRESLEEIVKSGEILAVGIARLEPDNGRTETILSGGNPTLLDPAFPVSESMFRWRGKFALRSDFGGGGFGGGYGSGFGRGRGRQAFGPRPDEGLFRPGQSYATVFVLDRTDADQRLRAAAWLRISLVVTGALILFLLTVAWRATFRLVEARGRERVLQSEANHLREMGQAAAGLAHETRNPLGLVRGWTQRLAREASSSASQKEQAQAVIEECDRVTARINQFLSFARPCQPQPDQVDLGELIEELMIILEPDLETRRLSLDYKRPAAPVFANVDREMFRQALFNLVSNAIAFSPDEGVIEIATPARQDGKTRIEIADRGPGVAPDLAESLFSPYFTTRSNGTGLGLAIVKRIARAHGWRVGYSMRPGGGSTFWLDEADGR